MLDLDKTEEEQKLTAFNTISGLGVSDVKRLYHNVRLHGDHLLDP